jgi:hypothetical protein
VDRAWTDLPINTAFLPFVQITTRYLAGRMKDPPRLDTTVGRRVELAVPPACTRARITAPREIVKEFEVSGLPLAGTPPARRLSFADTSAPGAYEIAFLGMPRGEERLGFVVNLDAESESDLRRISDQELAWFGGHRVESPVRGEVSMSYLDFQVERGLWAPLLAGVLFLLVGECLLARRP